MDVTDGGRAVGADEFHPKRRYRRGRWHRLENHAVGMLVTAGVVPHSYLLTTRGRRTGQPRRNPVTVVELDGRHWLVAPYGAVPWVHNARANGRVTLTRRLDTRRYELREVGAAEAGPVLKRYVALAGATRPYFESDRHDPADRFAAEAEHHPVFELIPVEKEAMAPSGGRHRAGLAATGVSAPSSAG